MILILDHEIPRLDRFLANNFPEIPRSRWDSWIREGHVSVNKQIITKSGTRMKAGDQVETELPDITSPGLHLIPESIEFPTLFEDDRIWIIAKPSGIVVHPGPGHPSGTVANALLFRLQAEGCDLQVDPATRNLQDEDEEEPATLWPGLVHRLDRYTTGCLVMAKDAEAQRNIQAQFKTRTIEKRYLAIARNSRKLPDLGSLLVDAPIARHRLERLKMSIATHGRPSQTRIKVMARCSGLALVECELLTGRTHQIRVHLSHLGAPILGDPMYGGATTWLDPDKRSITCEHPALHAWKLALNHPGTGERIVVEAPLPDPFRNLLDRFGFIPPPAR